MGGSYIPPQKPKAEEEKARAEHEQRCKEEADRIWKTIEGTVNK